MKNYFLKRKAKLEKLINETRERMQASEDINEVRSMGDTLDRLYDELSDVKAKLEELDEQGDEGGEGQQEQQASADSRGVNPMREFRTMGQYQTQQQAAAPADRTDSVEYRTAFMNYVCRNVPIPAELRADAVTTTADAGAVIPNTILGEIIREMRQYGDLFARVRRLQVQGGVQIPVSNLRPVAKWISANTATSESDKQKLQAKANDAIMFSYYGLECKLSQTLLTSITTLEVFQREFVTLAAEAIAQAMDIAIMNGSGNGEPLGITKDARVPSANVVTMSPTDIASWAIWKKKVFAKMKKAYRKGVFIMAQGTFDTYIDGLVDDHGQPIGRVNYGITDGEAYRFGGKEVLTVEDDVIADYEAAATGDVIGVFVDLHNYIVNSNMEMQIVKWVDNDTNELKNKAILVADGKLGDPYGVIIIKKGAAS